MCDWCSRCCADSWSANHVSGLPPLHHWEATWSHHGWSSQALICLIIFSRLCDICQCLYGECGWWCSQVAERLCRRVLLRFISLLMWYLYYESKMRDLKTRFQKVQRRHLNICVCLSWLRCLYLLFWLSCSSLYWIFTASTERLITKTHETGISHPIKALLYNPVAANNMYLTAVVTVPDYSYVMLSVDHPPGS